MSKVTEQGLSTQNPDSRSFSTAQPPSHSEASLPPMSLDVLHRLTHTPPKPPLSAPLSPRHSPRLYSRSAILAKCNLLTQEILLRGLGVMKTTMKLMGRPDLR